MSITLYEFSIPGLVRGLTNCPPSWTRPPRTPPRRSMIRWFWRSRACYPDMHPLTRQVQIACDTAKGAAARLANVEVPKHEDTEATLDELKQRIAKTLDFLKTVTAAQVNSAETAPSKSSFRTARGSSRPWPTSPISCCRISIST
jgi:hypothetical protein